MGWGLLQDISFINDNVGFTVGWFGDIYKTTNGGTNWISKISGTDKALFSISWINSMDAVIVGNSGTILKTTDGGNNWIQKSSGTTSTLLKVIFIGENTGWAVGYSGKILKQLIKVKVGFYKIVEQLFNYMVYLLLMRILVGLFLGLVPLF